MPRGSRGDGSGDSIGPGHDAGAQGGTNTTTRTRVSDEGKELLKTIVSSAEGSGQRVPAAAELTMEIDDPRFSSTRRADPDNLERKARAKRGGIVFHFT